MKLLDWFRSRRTLVLRGYSLARDLDALTMFTIRMVEQNQAILDRAALLENENKFLQGQIKAMEIALGGNTQETEEVPPATH